MVVTRTVLRYYGAKARIAEWVLSHVPPHVCWVDAFCGAGSITLRKSRTAFEVINDRNREVITFFRVLRDRRDDLLEALRFTPYARAEFEDAFLPTDSDLEIARHVYVRSWQAQHGFTDISTIGWRFDKTTNPVVKQTCVGRFADTSDLYAVADRLRKVQIECDDALKIIPRFDAPTTLTYCDPPYVTSTRASRWQKRGYVHEFHDDDHRRLADLLHACKGMVLLSGYPSPLYDELYPTWQRVEKQTIKNSHAEATECLWLNPAAASAVRQRPLPLDGVA